MKIDADTVFIISVVILLAVLGSGMIVKGHLDAEERDAACDTVGLEPYVGQNSNHEYIGKDNEYLKCVGIIDGQYVEEWVRWY